jgi:fluoride ion exporter CrcB/FEX
MLVLFEFSANQTLSKPMTGPSQAYPNTGYGVMMFLSYAIITIAVSIGGYRLGHHTALILDHILVTWELSTLELGIEITIALLGICGWIAVSVLSIIYPAWRYWTLSSAFGPFGVFARYWLAKTLNKRRKNFVLGTFTANMLATILISILTILEYGVGPKGSSLLIKGVTKCQIVSALANGFCGNFSTVSSFVAELDNFQRLKHSYIYGITTIAGGFSIIVVILGTYTWTRGLTNTVC